MYRVCPDLLVRYKQPVLLETFLPGREFTVGIVGTGKRAEVLGVMEIILRDNAEADVYSYTNKEECESRIDYVLVDDPLLMRVGTRRSVLRESSKRVSVH
ncbi:MAG: hypothetical protein P8Z37_18310 [Acidobacteriota bacterium]